MIVFAEHNIASVNAARGRAQEWWRENFPVHHTVRVPGARGISLAAARNQAMRQFGAPGVPLIIVDGDTHPMALSSVIAAEQACLEDPSVVHLPNTEVQVRSVNTRAMSMRSARMDGIYVSTPEVWWKVGGMDERFATRDGAGLAFARAHRIFLGRDVQRHRGSLIRYQLPAALQVPLFVDADVDLEHSEADTSRKLRWVVRRGNAGATP